MNTLWIKGFAVGLALVVFNWPVVAALLSTTKGNFDLYVYLCAAVLDVSIAFWLIFIALFKCVAESPDYATHKRNRIILSVYCLVFGFIISMTSTLLASKLLSLYLGDFSSFLSESSYITSLCIIMSMILWLVVVVSIFALQSECSSTRSARRWACFGIWCMFATFLVILYIYSAQFKPLEDCRLINKYWNVVFVNLLGFITLSLLFGICYLTENTESLEYTEPNFFPRFNNGMKLIGALYFGVFFPFNLYWFGKGLAYLLQGDIQNCNENLTAVMINVMLYTCTLALGLLGVFGIVVSIIAIILNCVFKLCCPTWYNSLWHMAFSTDAYEPSSLTEPLNVELESEEFEPGKHTREFMNEEVCSICLEGYKEKQQVVYWNSCKHLFHKDCLEFWVEKNPTCPNCKQPYHEL